MVLLCVFCSVYLIYVGCHTAVSALPQTFLGLEFFVDFCLVGSISGLGKAKEGESGTVIHSPAALTTQHIETVKSNLNANGRGFHPY